MEKILNKIEQRLGKIDNRLDSIDGRFDKLEIRFDGLETRFDGLETRFDGLEEKVDTISFELNEFQITTKEEFDRIHGKIDRTWSETLLNGDAIARLDRKISMELAAHSNGIRRLEQHCGI